MRRVRKLKIKTQDESSATPDINALQEAFKLASLPGIPPNGLLLIKKLDLGVYRSNSSPVSIANLIDQRIQSAVWQPNCIDHEEQPDSNAVWFSNPAQAVFRLVELTLTKSAPQAWYWPLLFPLWQQSMNLTELMKVINSHHQLPESKPVMLAQVILQIDSHRNTSTALNAVSELFAQQMLVEAGIYPSLAHTSVTKSVIKKAFSAKLQLHHPWRKLVEAAMIKWGRNDVRTLWFSFSGMISQNPALVKINALLPILQTVIADIAVDIDHQPRDKKRTAESDNPLVNEQSIQTEQALVEASGIRPAVESILNSQPDSQQPVTSSEKPIDLAHNQAGYSSADQDPIDDPVVDPTQAVNQPPVNPERSQQPISQDNNSAAEPHPVQLDGFYHSEQAGLAFLIALLELLWISDSLSENEFMAHINFPLRLIKRVAQRMNISADHPVIEAIADLPEADFEEIDQFRAPPGWQRLITSPNAEATQLLRFSIEGDASLCYITDRSRKLLLYVGSNNPVDIPDWLTACTTIEPPGLHQQPTLVDLENTWLLLLSRYLYRYAKLGLCQMLNRPGRIASSKTHLDILFNMKQIDIRIRMAGLDINPGWVPWLARVVQFHYVEGEKSDA